MAAEFWVGATKEEYHADPALSQSALKVYMRDPQQFYRQYVARTEPRKPPTPSMVFGTQVEDLAFRNTLNAVIIPQSALHPNGSKMNAAGQTNWSSWRDQQLALHGPDVQLLKAEEFSKPMGPAAVIQAVDNLRGHEVANTLVFGDSIKNVRIRWVDEFTGLPCRCEIDLIHANAVIGDLKTTTDPSEDGFAKSVVNFGYAIQSFMYREALRKVADYLDQQPDSDVFRFCRPMLERVRDGQPLLCCWVAVKNTPSYFVEVHPVADEWYTIAETVVRQKMFELKRSYETGVWQTQSHGRITKLKPPKWAYNILEGLSQDE